MSEEAQFDWVGVFPYYQEEDTPAAELKEQIEGYIKQDRLDQLMGYTAQITKSKMSKYLNRILPVLVVDSAHDIYGDNWFAGRSQYQAPEVDGMIYFSSKNAQIGDMVQVEIIDNDIYDLIGVEI